MEKSKVYFTDFRTGLGVSLTVKLQRLIKMAGIGSIDMDGKFVAIKMHFGELGNLAYLRPNYAKAVADVIKECGGLPFLTDCNTLYPGSRKHALEHLDCANINGFNTITTGCQIIIADGLRGTDDIVVPVPNGEYCKEAYIGRAVMDADIFISLNHFKGHEMAGFGDAVILGLVTVIIAFFGKAIIQARFSYYEEFLALPMKILRRMVCLSSEVIFSSAVVFYVFMIGMKVRIGNRFLKLMGSITLEFYLIHGLYVELFSYSFDGKADSLVYIKNSLLFSIIVFTLSFPSALLIKILRKCIRINK